MSSFAADAYDEAHGPDGAPRHAYGALLAALDSVELAGLAARVRAGLERDGVTFGGETFVADAIPRLLSAAEWGVLEAGLAQRAQALNHFLRDAYGARRIVDAGLIEDRTITGAEGFEPDLCDRLPPGSAPAAVIGFDVVREPGGTFLVLEDNVRTPSGFAYALAMRAVLERELPPTGLNPRPIAPVTYELLGAALRAAAPPGVEAPRVVVLTDGPQNVAYHEHAQAAAGIGAPLVRLEDLRRDGDRLLVRSQDGAQERVDIVYRRTDEDRARDDDGRLTAVAELLLEPWLDGTLGLVNAFGNGVADDKLVHAHVEDFVRFYLGEEPLIGSVPTQALGSDADRDAALGRLEQLVVKPRHGHGGHGVVIGAHASDAQLAELTAELTAGADGYISQPLVSLSRHPTVLDGRLQHRHVDLRPFAFTRGERTELMPGGLSRVALQDGSLIVNSSQDGGGKDTWVLP
jgi:uncharacterized circularly permuted ATP-grasp superfamily protein